MKRAYIKGGFQLPTNTGGSFRQVVSGVSDINLSFHKPIFPKLHLGILLEHGYHVVNDVKITELTEGNLQFIGGMLAITYSGYSDKKAFFEADLNVGYQYTLVNSLTCKEKGKGTHNSEGLVIKPKIGIYFKSNENLSFGLTMSYNYMFSEFGPETLCLTQFNGFESKNFTSNYQFFAIGFGFKTRFQTKK